MSWYKVLQAARRVGKGNAEQYVTSDALAAAAKLRGTETSSPESIASGWLSKFVRWGYVLRVGRIPSKGRPRTVYRLTQWGLTYHPKKKAARRR